MEIVLTRAVHPHICDQRAAVSGEAMPFGSAGLAETAWGCCNTPNLVWNPILTVSKQLSVLVLHDQRSYYLFAGLPLLALKLPHLLEKDLQVSVFAQFILVE